VSPLAAPLKGYTFAVRTNLKKKLLTNRDALCILFYVNGHLTLAQARDALMTWRYGKATYVVTMTRDWDRYRYEMHNGKATPVAVYRARPKITFGAWFNMSPGYCHCGDDLMSPGEWMDTYTYRHRGKVDGEKFWYSHHTRHFRRHYWYRCAPGRYAGTVEGVKRMSEMIKEIDSFPVAWKKRPQ